MKKLILLVSILLLVSSISYAKKARKHKQQPAQQQETNVIEDGSKETRKDPCLKHKCGAGKECFVNAENGEAKCQCVSQCVDNTDLRRRVCSNHNTTWQSDCHLFKHRCLCVTGASTDCTEEHKHMHIDYYGECQLLPKCRKEVLEDFPRRMTEWLDTIMSKKIPKPKDHEDGHLTSKWIDAIIWKFCDLDKQPHDRHVSRHELFPLRAPLLSMESCISEFLDGCDADDDHKITLTEWGKCLGANSGEMEDKCAQFTAQNEEETA